MGKNLLVSHIDTDGAGAVIIAFLFGIVDDLNDVIMIDYKELHTDEEKTKSALPLNPEYEKVYYVDLNIDEVTYYTLCDYYGYDNVLFFDHHQDSYDFKGLQNTYVDENRCGTRLFYDYLREGKRVPSIWDEFVRLVDVYDRWLVDDPLRERAEDLNRVYYKVADFRQSSEKEKFRPFINQQIEKLQLNRSLREFPFTDYEYHQIQLAREKEDREYGYALDNVQKREDSNGNLFMLFHGASKISYIANRMLKENPDISYVVAANTWTGDPKRREISGKISIRSRVDGPVHANDFKGVNGHLAAAGGELDVSFVRSLLEGEINEIERKDPDEQKGLG